MHKLLVGNILKPNILCGVEWLVGYFSFICREMNLIWRNCQLRDKNTHLRNYQL